jgi:methyl-accepting chemotaxis protein
MSSPDAKVLDERSQYVRTLARRVREIADEYDYRGQKELSVLAHDLARRTEGEADALQQAAERLTSGGKLNFRVLP